MNITVAGILVAGGKSSRMGGGDKCMRLLAGKPILEHIIERVGPQVSQLVINTNGDPKRFSSFGLQVILDSVDGYFGPLAGVLSGMEWTKKNLSDCKWIVTIATDTPFLPANLVQRLIEAATNYSADVTFASSAQRRHPVFGLWPVSLSDDLRHALIHEGIRKIDHWANKYNCVEVAFDEELVDPFFYINKPDDLVQAELLLDSYKLSTNNNYIHSKKG